MQVVLIDQRRGFSQVYELRKGIVITVAALIIAASSAFYLGIRFGTLVQSQYDSPDAGFSPPESIDQDTNADRTKLQNQNKLEALAIRLGQLQSQMLRLNAVGQRVVNKIDLGNDEFDFTQIPPMGGLDAGNNTRAQDYHDLLKQTDFLSAQINDREIQLTALDEYRTNRQIRKQGYPAGRPIISGWLSSHYGWRNDPFSGRRTFHHGIDFAGKKGSDVVAVAAGVVLSAVENRGYGKLVVIDHGDGYITRYGHNREVTVVSGERVRQGQTIARMGSTGRSTGPHVHFEVLRFGKKVNPIKFIRAKR